MPPIPGRGNRIEIDLKLLEDNNLQKLQQFGQQFSKSVNDLGLVLGKYADQIGTAARISSGNDPEASDSRQVYTSGLTARMGGRDPEELGYGGAHYQFANAPPGGGQPPYGGGGQASMGAQPPAGEQPPAAVVGGAGDPFEFAYVRATRRIGEHLPVGLRQVFGYAAEGALPTQREPRMKDDNGNEVPVRDAKGRVVPAGHVLNEDGVAVPGRLMRIGGTVSDIMFTSQAVNANLQLMGSHLANTRDSFMNATQFGQNVGYSGGSGPLGIAGAFSPAFWASMGQNWNAMKMSWFGFNPNMPTSVAKELTGMVNQYGYAGADANHLTDIMKNVWIKSKVDPSVQMQFLDPMMRFGGGEDLQQIIDLLQEGIPTAAKAARMNLQEFSKELASAAEQVSLSTGMTVANAGSAITAISTTTGLNPTVVGQMMSDPRQTLLASAMSGQSIWDLTTGHKNAGAYMQFGLMQFKNATGGYTASQILKGLKDPKTHAQFDQIMSRVQYLYMTNHNIFGGMSPIQMLHAEAATGGTTDTIINRTQAVQDIDTANVHHSNNWTQMIQHYGVSAARQRQWEQGVREAMAKVNPLDPNAMVKRQEAAKSYLLNQIGNQQQKQSKDAAVKVSIGLNPDARRWFQIMEQNTGGKGHTNQWIKAAGYAREASNAFLDPEYLAAEGLGKLGVPGAKTAAHYLKYANPTNWIP